MVKDLWQDEGIGLNPGLDGLVYRSNLLGRDRSIANAYGGNTSVKTIELDHAGREVGVLWVKGSGSDLAGIKENDFAGLILADMLPLYNRQAMTDEEMVEYLSHCVFALNRPRQSIESLLHAFLPARHIDHTHPDAVISIACTPSGRELTHELWGNQAIWVDYEQPGFSLSKHIAQALQNNPEARLIVMGRHGLVTWGDTSQTCYTSTIQAIQEAEAFIEKKRAGRNMFAPAAVSSPDPEERKKIWLEIMPILRGALSKTVSKILCVDDSQEVLDFVNYEQAAELSQRGAACPDHILRTRNVPLFVDWKPKEGAEVLKQKLADGVQSFTGKYLPYQKEYKDITGLDIDPAPRVILIPGLGMVTGAEDAKSARMVGQIYQRAIIVMKGSQALDRFISLTAEEAHSLEFWPLELYKLSLRPVPAEFTGKVVAVTGAADGIGKATAIKFAELGAHVAIMDINLAGAEQVAGEIVKKYGQGKAIPVHCNVSDESAVSDAFQKIVWAYGGVDIVVSNAGIFRGDAVENTSLKDWNLVLSVNETGYFLVSREAFRLWKQQATGGNLVFVGSKNSVRAGKNALAYSAAKAAELHMARCLAEEGGEAGIRVNTVLPDAVLRGSALFTDDVKKWRAESYGIKPEELEDYYLQRCILKIPVFPENVADAILFLASSRSSRTTGGAITVDGGVGTAFMR